jgi:signal transduction histidine kinase
MTDTRDAQAKLLSLAVHEFRTPVSVVSGYLRMLLRHFGENLTDQQRKLLQESEKSCGNLAHLLTELSDLAHFDDGAASMPREPIPIFGLLEHVAADVHEGEDRGVRLEIRGAGVEAVVRGDRDRLRTALASLLAAALRERVEGVVVAACTVRTEPGHEAVIVIADSDTVEEIGRRVSSGTQPFDQYRGGMGFRLPLAARIVAAHGGRVSSPEAARGRLAIVLSLPLATESEKAA